MLLPYHKNTISLTLAEDTFPDSHRGHYFRDTLGKSPCGTSRCCTIQYTELLLRIEMGLKELHNLDLSVRNVAYVDLSE